MFFFSCCAAPEVDTNSELVTNVQPAVPVKVDESACFVCKVKRDDGKWGASLDGWGDCIQVIDVMQEGKIQEYNDTTEEFKLQPGDFILQVDEQQVTKDTLPALKAMAEADFKVFKPKALQVRIEKGVRKEGMGWGLKLNYQEKKSTCLRIVSIHDGGVADFNKDAEKPVQEKDFIVEVNGCHGDPAKMLETFKDSHELDLKVVRLP